MPEKYVQINIGSSHLSDQDWTELKADTEVALLSSVRSGVPHIGTHLGTGAWEGWEEQSAHISAIADVDTYALRVKLRGLAAKYCQDTIALIVGSHLIVGTDI